MESDIQVVILCNDQDTPLDRLPSCLKTYIGKKRFITYLLDRLSDYGFKEVILCCGQHYMKIMDVLGFSYESLNLVYCVETEDVGTCGLLKKALPLLKSSYVLLMDATRWLDLDLAEFETFHCHYNPDISVALIKREEQDSVDYSKVIMNFSGRIISYTDYNSENAHHFSTGTLFFNREKVSSLLSESDCYSLEKDFLAKTNIMNILGCEIDGSLVDIEKAIKMEMEKGK